MNNTTKYPEYEATQIALNQILWYDFENEDIPGKEDLVKLENASPFADKLKERVLAMGYSGDIADAEALRSFLFQLLLDEQGIISEENARVWKANLKNWLIPKKDSPAPIMPGKREPVYQLCFALRMNAFETGEFFVKGYLERPYNFKDLKETVYFFCLNNGLRYADAMVLYQTAQAMPYHENSSSETDTRTLGRMVSEIHNKEAFLDYIRENRWSFETMSVSAKNKIAQLIKLCLPYATKEYNTFNFSARQEAIGIRDEEAEKDDNNDGNQNFDVRPVSEVKIRSAEALLSVIYGYYARETRKEGENDIPVYSKTLNRDSHFPKLIRERMVSNAMQLSAIQKGIAPNAITRSALILFSFYYFFSSAKENGCVATIDLFDEFIDEVDRLLLECGQGQLYPRNPYDRMIIYCARSTDPLNELRLLIDEFFLDDETVIS